MYNLAVAAFTIKPKVSRRTSNIIVLYYSIITHIVHRFCHALCVVCMYVINLYICFYKQDGQRRKESLELHHQKKAGDGLLCWGGLQAK